MESIKLNRGMALLRLPDFRRLLFGNFLWWQARWMEAIILGWLVLEMTDSPWQVALIGFYRSIPLLVMGFFSGMLIDRFGRRKIIISAQAGQVIVSLTFLALIWFDQVAIWHLALGSLILGISWSVDWPARRSLIPDLVGKRDTMDAMLMENFGASLSRIFGPFASGSLLALLGPRGGYFVLSAFSLLALWLLMGISKPAQRSTPITQVSQGNQVWQGLAYVRQNPSILGAFLITIIMNFLIFPYDVLLPVFARDVLNQGAFELGLLGAAAGAGALLGLLVVSQVRRYLSHGWIFALGSSLQALALLSFANSELFYLSLLLLFLSGVGQACFGIMQSTIVLLAAEDDMRSRAMGAIVLGIGVGPLGRLQIGALAENVSAPFALSLHGGLAFLFLILVMVKLPKFRQKLVLDPP